MDNNIKEKKEALETLIDFNQRLVKNMTIIVKELSGNPLDDTLEFLKGILDAMNWEIQVMNGTMDLLNNERERINKEAFNDKIIKLSEKVKEKDDEGIASAIQDLIPEFENLQNSAKEVV